MPEEPRSAYRFTTLLAMLVLVLIGAPILQAVEPEGLPRLANVITGVLFFGMLLSAIAAVTERRATVVITLLLVGMLIALWSVNQSINSTWIAVVAEAEGAVLLGFTITVLFRHLFRTDRVTWNTIAASLCIYLLMIVLWAELYSIMALLDPMSFKIPPGADGAMEVRKFGGQGNAMALYYSLVTMTTLGYGDIVPVSPPARMLAGLQAVTGQLYIAVLVARLVGLHVVHSRSENRA
jgi:hypothetical protein